MGKSAGHQLEAQTGHTFSETRVPLVNERSEEGSKSSDKSKTHGHCDNVVACQHGSEEGSDLSWEAMSGKLGLDQGGVIGHGWFGEGGGC